MNLEVPEEEFHSPLNPADLPYPHYTDIMRLTSGEVYDLLLRTEASIMNVIVGDDVQP